MGSDPHPESGGAIEHSAGYITFTSQAYAATNDDEATRQAAEWLEAQSVHPFLREVATRSLIRLGLQTGESVLDVGCGTGVFLPALAEIVGADGRVVGLDHSTAFLEDARQRLIGAFLADRVELIEGDAHRLPFPDGTFDAVHCERVLMHLEDPGLAVAEMRRVVRPGGRVLLAEVYAVAARMAHPDPAAEQLISAGLVSGIRNTSMGIGLRELLIRTGFTDVGGEVVGYFEEELDQDEAEEWTAVARGLVARGILEADRAEAAISAMEDLRARGAHCGVALIFAVSGRVPGGAPDGA